MNAMNAEQRLRENCTRLRAGGQTLRDLYGVIFDASARDLTACETVTSVRVRARTYGELRAKIESVAAALSERIGSGDRYVGLLAPNSEDWPVLFWAILRSGNRPVLMDVRRAGSFHASTARTLDFAAAVALPRGGEEVPALPCPVLDGAELLGRAPARDPLSADAPFGDAVVFASAGTDLSDSLFVCRGAALVDRILGFGDLAAQNPQIFGKRMPKSLVALPLAHRFGLSASCLWWAVAGGALVFSSDRGRADGEPTVEHLLHAARRCEVTHLFAYPRFWDAAAETALKYLSEVDERGKVRSAVARLVRDRRKRSASVPSRFRREIRVRLLPDSLVLPVSVGAPLGEETAALLNLCGYPIVSAYGTTELGVTSIGLGEDLRGRVDGAVGRPFGSSEYRVEADGRLFAVGGSAASERFVNGTPSPLFRWIDTGDAVTVTPRGSYVVTGRIADLRPVPPDAVRTELPSKEVLRLDGERVDPCRIARAFRAGKGTASAVTVQSGIGTVLVISFSEVPAPEVLDRVEREIRETNETLPSALRVSAVRYTRDPLSPPHADKPSLPYLDREIAAGRIALFDREAAEKAWNAESVGMREKILALIVEIFDVPPETVCGAENLMTELGGSSLDYFTLVGELDRTFDIRLPYESEGFGYSLDDIERLVKELLKAKCDSSTNSSDGSP